MGLLALCSCTSYPEIRKEYKDGMCASQRGGGQCVHKSNRLSAYLHERKLKHEFKVGYRQASDQRTHAWVEIIVNSERYVLDPEWRRIYKNPKDKYFAFDVKEGRE